MKFYQVYDVQLDEIRDRKVTKDDIIEHAYIIMKDRAEAVNDELSDEFNEVIKDGVKGISFEKALETLNLWEYEVYELQLVGEGIEKFYK